MFIAIAAIERALTQILIWMAVGFFIAGTFLYSFQIISRILFQDSFFWIDALISYLFTLAALMGASLAVRSRENIKIDILRHYAEKPKIRLFTDGFSSIVTILLLLIFSSHTEELYTSNSYSVFGISEWIFNIPYLLLFTGSLFYYGQLLHKDFRSLSKKSNPNKP